MSVVKRFLIDEGDVGLVRQRTMLHFGKVVSVSTTNPVLYSVRYEDGDSEDYSEDELKRHLVSDERVAQLRTFAAGASGVSAATVEEAKSPNKICLKNYKGACVVLRRTNAKKYHGA